MRLDRLLAIIVKLLNHSHMPAQKLAEDFEVSVRTIYRDMEAINAAGIPVISSQGNQGGFGIMENFKLDHQVFTSQDLVSMLSVLKGFQAVFADRDLKMAAEKIQSLIPRERQGEIQARLEQVVIDMLPWGIGAQQKEILQQIQQAIANNRVLQFKYQNSQGKNTQRQAEPMTLIIKGYAWYLFAYCRLKRDFRIFRLNRMHQLKTLKQTFVRKTQSYEPYLQAASQPQKSISVTLRFSPQARHRVDDYFSQEQIRKDKNGAVLVRFSLPENEWLYNFLLSFGEEIEVLKPASLRSKLCAKAEKIMRCYKPDIGLSQRLRKLSVKS